MPWLISRSFLGCGLLPLVTGRRALVKASGKTRQNAAANKGGKGRVPVTQAGFFRLAHFGIGALAIRIRHENGVIPEFLCPARWPDPLSLDPAFKRLMPSIRPRQHQHAHRLGKAIVAQPRVDLRQSLQPALGS